MGNWDDYWKNQPKDGPDISDKAAELLKTAFDFDNSKEFPADLTKVMNTHIPRVSRIIFIAVIQIL